MSFGLGHGRTLDPAPGLVGISGEELGPLPDDIGRDPAAGRVDPRGWFAEPGRAFEIEIGSGKGTFLVQQAELEPATNFLGIEWAGECYAYAADRVRRRREAGTLANVRLLHADATEFLRWRCAGGIARVIHLYFSDPWPKTRHHKKRVVGHRFLAEAWRVLEGGGEVRVVTDHDGLWAWDMAHFAAWADAAGWAMPSGGGPVPEIPAEVAALRASMPEPAFEMLPFDRPGSAGAGEIVGTNFERKFRREGRGFHACVLRKR
jgi:tRNA (guanine-N7-)-methyltransferase